MDCISIILNRRRITYLIKGYVLVFIFILFCSKDSYAIYRSKCNINEHCRIGWYCANGNPDKGTASQDLEGVCKPNIIARQLCTLHKGLVLVFGRFVILFGVMVVGWAFLQGKFELKTIITMILGAILILAPYPIITLVTRKPYSACDFPMTLNNAGFLPV